MSNVMSWFAALSTYLSVWNAVFNQLTTAIKLYVYCVSGDYVGKVDGIPDLNYTSNQKYGMEVAGDQLIVGMYDESLLKYYQLSES